MTVNLFLIWAILAFLGITLLVVSKNWKIIILGVILFLAATAIWYFNPKQITVGGVTIVASPRLPVAQ